MGKLEVYTRGRWRTGRKNEDLALYTVYISVTHASIIYSKVGKYDSTYKTVD